MAAITFPTSPSDGDTFETNGRIYIYSSTYDSWSSASSSGIFTGNVVTYSSATVFPTVGNTQGNFAFDRENLALYIWDGTEWDRIISGTAPSITIDYLMQAGGGGGGTNWGAGGGAGGLLIGRAEATVGDSYSIVIGAGGITENNGSDTTFDLITQVALGGGKGGANAGSAGIYGANGGCGGGGGAGTSTGGLGGSGAIGQGNDGEYANPSSSAPSGAGGGGTAYKGERGVTTSGGGNGGDGRACSITGSSVYYGGGGGGGTSSSYTAGSGGLGGGGNGANSGAASNGTANTGGGGGGGATSSGLGGTGGSGIVIVSYKNATQLATGGTVTSYTTGSNTVWVHTFTSSGSITFG